MKKTYCDKCELETPVWDIEMREINHYSAMTRAYWKPMDLCKPCNKKLRDVISAWLGQKESSSPSCRSFRN